MIVSPSQAFTRMVSVLTYSDQKPASNPIVSREDHGKGLVISTQPTSSAPTWDWLLAGTEIQDVDSNGYIMIGKAVCA